MTLPLIRLKRKEEKRVASGHLWVFSNEIETIENTPAVGDVVEVKSKSNDSLGFGFYNPKTLIAVRLYSKKFAEPDAAFFSDRLSAALRLREGLFKTPFYRLVYGESDFLPGLIIDRYGPLFSVQIYSAAMERRKDLIFGALEEMFSPAAIYERNESSTRELEGLPQFKSIAKGEDLNAEYDEDGIKFNVVPFHGQKTGFYYDQRLNRIFSRSFARSAVVLDLFSNEGGFGLNMAYAGAAKVVSVDSSEPAIGQLKVNAALNGLRNVEGVVSDANTFIDTAAAAGQKYDVVVCDPPSFTRNRKMVTVAKAGYRRLHENVFRVLKTGGILMTATCSHHIYRDTFEEVVDVAARKSGRTLQLLHRAGASPDHPILPGMPETEYLKFNVYRAI